MHYIIRKVSPMDTWHVIDGPYGPLAALTALELLRNKHAELIAYDILFIEPYFGGGSEY